MTEVAIPLLATKTEKATARRPLSEESSLRSTYHGAMKQPDCAWCGKLVPLERVYNAISRAKKAKFCSRLCAGSAATKAYRDRQIAKGINPWKPLSTQK